MKGSRVPPSGEEVLAESPDQGRLDRTELYTTGEMARISGTTLRTVRFYEEAGILKPVGRTDGGHRLFRQSELDRLMLVSDMREAGMNLDEIRVLLETKSRARSGADAAKEAQTALTATVARLKEKIAAMSRLEADLSQTIACTNACRDCGDQQLFPDHCAQCERMQCERMQGERMQGDRTTSGGKDATPRALRVLWSLGEVKRA
jgi:DNA-binding transcriptional MerR regulator